MYVCFFYFSAATAQIKPQKHIKPDKKEVLKKICVIEHANNTLYKCNKSHYNLHAYCTLNHFSPLMVSVSLKAFADIRKHSLINIFFMTCVCNFFNFICHCFVSIIKNG